MYHCFGCGVGGNVFTFVMEYEKVSFLEAVRSLAEKAGIALRKVLLPMIRWSASRKISIKFAGSRSPSITKRSSSRVKENLPSTIFTNAGFTDETIRTFGLGYAPNSWDAIIQFGEQKVFFFLNAGESRIGVQA